MWRGCEEQWLGSMQYFIMGNIVKILETLHGSVEWPRIKPAWKNGTWHRLSITKQSTFALPTQQIGAHSDVFTTLFIHICECCRMHHAIQYCHGYRAAILVGKHIRTIAVAAQIVAAACSIEQDFGFDISDNWNDANFGTAGREQHCCPHVAWIWLSNNGGIPLWTSDEEVAFLCIKRPWRTELSIEYLCCCRRCGCFAHSAAVRCDRCGRDIPPNKRMFTVPASGWLGRSGHGSQNGR